MRRMILLLLFPLLFASAAAPQTAKPSSLTGGIDKQAATLYNSGKFPEAFTVYQRAANLGDLNAENLLGYMYQHGQGVPRNYEQALAWYTKAAAQGLAASQANLGSMYESAQGVAQDYPKALFLYQLAADQGNVIAENNLGHMFQFGEGVTQNYPLARHWYEKAAAEGLASAQANLGNLYLKGLGVDPDSIQARIWLEKADAQGDTDAHTSLAHLLAASSTPPPARTASSTPAPTSAPANPRPPAPTAPGQTAAIATTPAPTFASATVPASTTPVPTAQAVATPPPPSVSNLQTAPVPQPAPACAVVLEAATADASGTHWFYGAAWASPTVAEAGSKAEAQLIHNVNGIPIFKTRGGKPFGDHGVVTVASGCDSAHGAVAAAFKRDSKNALLGAGVYDPIAATLAPSTAAADAAAMKDCAQHATAAQDVCQVLAHW